MGETALSDRHILAQSLRARFNEEEKKTFNFINWIELELDLIGKKSNKQEGISIVRRGKFDSIQFTKKALKDLL